MVWMSSLAAEGHYLGSRLTRVGFTVASVTHFKIPDSPHDGF